jgi:hypothetical protein
MENDGIEMAKMHFDDEEIASNGLPELMEWVDSRTRRQNLCYAFLIASMVIAGAVYVLEGAQTGNSNNDIISGEVSTEDNQELKCEDLTQYEDWLATTVTKKDGKKYETLKQMKHDSKAFTYVYVNGI